MALPLPLPLLLLSCCSPSANSIPHRPRFHFFRPPPAPSYHHHHHHHHHSRHLHLPASLPPSRWGDDAPADAQQKEDYGIASSTQTQRAKDGDASLVLTACALGLFTGLAVVLFNYAVHEIRDLFWDGLPLRGASWLRQQPIQHIWPRLLFVPASGGLIVGILNSLRTSLNKPSRHDNTVPAALLKALAASITLGTGNSLGPEGPSVEIGSQIAKGFGNLLQWSGGKRLSLVAAGSAAGISSGFNAAVGGCFFAVESVLWPSSAADSSSSLANSTPVVILSSVIASVISEVGLGTDPAFIVPQYDFRSPTELPLYLLLGILCGLVSVALSYCTSFSVEVVERLHQKTGLSKAIFPVVGGLCVGIMALKYPEVLYWGFENVDALLESRPFTEPLSAVVLVQLVGVKIVATSLCRASGLVGGYYAPSLFIGAATGMAYGRFLGTLFGGPSALFHLPLLEVASPQAYGLVGMAATLAGVCQVPLTSVLLLFELTQDYRIVLPLLGAVGISSWISSSRQKRSTNYVTNAKYTLMPSGTSKKQPDTAGYVDKTQLRDYNSDDSDSSELCVLESSLCLYDEESEFGDAAQSVNVSDAMERKYESIVSMETPIAQVLNVMIEEKQPFVVITNNEHSLLGLLTLDGILEFVATGRQSRDRSELFVHDICKSGNENLCRVRQYATPDMRLLEAESIMNLNGVEHLPVVSSNKDLTVVGVIDRECISIALRAWKAKELLRSSVAFAERAPKT